MAMVFGSESFERFLQSSWEMYVDNCRLPVICFSRIYISIYSWWKYRYPWWLLAISQCDWVGYSDVPVIVCTMTWVGGGFPSIGYTTHQVSVNVKLTCIYWLVISLLARSWILMYYCRTSPLLLWTRSWVVLVGTSTLSDIFLQDCRIAWHLYSQ